MYRGFSRIQEAKTRVGSVLGSTSLLDRVGPHETHDLLEHPQTGHLRCSTVPKMGYGDGDPVLSLLSVASLRS